MTSVCCQGLLKHKVHFWGHWAKLPWRLHLQVYQLKNVQPGFFASAPESYFRWPFKVNHSHAPFNQFEENKSKKGRKKQGRASLWDKPGRIIRKEAHHHVFYFSKKLCTNLTHLSDALLHLCVLLITKDRSTAQSSMIRACRPIILQRWTYKSPKIN